ncbi:hypothetical protein TSUD_283970 [Trifolium subterraneum]|uniref:Replication factor A C-terminal domain-containing protein n=1 Tax=Trifolium subterraneum TaxID=3900 RepID=A0A2Z6P4B4_TRISU|nr:hypothetical protein TSUD_283970 [Trifolium subterraneum]
MAYDTIDPAEAMDFLRAPLNPFPLTYQERRLNDMRIKYRTYIVEYSVHECYQSLSYGVCHIASKKHSIDMASTGIYVKMTKISEICGGKVDFELRVRVINLWTTPDRSNPAEEGAIHMIFLDAMVDVIGHVVEKNTMDATLEDLEGNRIHCTLWDDYAVKMQHFLDNHDPSLPVIIILQLCKLKKYLGSMRISNSFYGSKLFLNADVPEVVSQMTGPPLLSIADEILHTQRMTIEDLIEANECYGSVLAWACEFDTDAGWFYHACSKCASRINFISGQLYCDKCTMPRTAIPRFKVHLQVIDDTGSITFVLFDRVISQVIGRTAQDLLDAMNNVEHNSGPYPSDLDVFVDKRMLFKVEVTDANLYRNWRGYTVKKVTSDEDIINSFMSLHGISFAGDGDDANFIPEMCNLDHEDSLDVVEGGDSTTNEGVFVSDITHTPTSKITGKNIVNSDAVGASAAKKVVFPIETIDLSDSAEPSVSKVVGKRSANPNGKDVIAPKETKMTCVKVEPN